MIRGREASRSMFRLAVPVLLSAALMAAGCGSDPRCGDGTIDLGEECDDGNSDETDICLSTCLLRMVPRLEVAWEFNLDVAPGFTGDSCSDIGAFGGSAQVDIVSATDSYSETAACTNRQVVFRDIPGGTYEATLRVMSSSGALLTTAPVTQTIDFSGGEDKVFINILPDAWAQSYTGTFFFRLSWEGDDCAAASPAVTQHVLRLEQNGVAVPFTTDSGDALDGLTPAPCRSLTEGTAQFVLDVPFGDARFTVEGRDAVGVTHFRSTFDTFVGAGAFNPEYEFDVETTHDAGLDGGIDGGAPDAGI